MQHLPARWHHYNLVLMLCPDSGIYNGEIGADADRFRRRPVSKPHIIARIADTAKDDLPSFMTLHYRW